MKTVTWKQILLQLLSFRWAWSWMIMDSDDPTCHCALYKDKGCSHVDSCLCHYPNCAVLKEYKRTKACGSH